MYNVHLTHSLLCFEFVEFTLNKKYYQRIDFYKISNSLFFNLYLVQDIMQKQAEASGM